jgi:hypothetical protein
MDPLALVVVVLVAFMASLDRDFCVPFLVLVWQVATDRASALDAVVVLLASATAGLGAPAGDIAMRLLVRPAFRGMGLFSIGHNKGPLNRSAFASHPLLLDAWLNETTLR